MLIKGRMVSDWGEMARCRAGRCMGAEFKEFKMCDMDQSDSYLEARSMNDVTTRSGINIPRDTGIS